MHTIELDFTEMTRLDPLVVEKEKTSMVARPWPLSTLPCCDYHVLIVNAFDSPLTLALI